MINYPSSVVGATSWPNIRQFRSCGGCRKSSDGNGTGRKQLTDARHVCCVCVVERIYFKDGGVIRFLLTHSKEFIREYEIYPNGKQGHQIQIWKLIGQVGCTRMCVCFFLIISLEPIISPRRICAGCTTKPLLRVYDQPDAAVLQPMCSYIFFVGRVIAKPKHKRKTE